MNDLGKRPIWELSCYGLNISWETGRNILNSDVSPEELRLEAYAQNMMLGNITAYLETLARTRAERSLLIKRILDDPSGAVLIARAALVQPASLASSVSQGSLALSSDQIALAPPQMMPPQVHAPPQVSLQAPPQVLAQPVPPQATLQVFQFGQIPDLPPP